MAGVSDPLPGLVDKHQNLRPSTGTGGKKIDLNPATSFDGDFGGFQLDWLEKLVSGNLDNFPSTGVGGLDAMLASLNPAGLTPDGFAKVPSLSNAASLGLNALPDFGSSFNVPSLDAEELNRHVPDVLDRYAQQVRRTNLRISALESQGETDTGAAGSTPFATTQMPALPTPFAAAAAQQVNPDTAVLQSSNMDAAGHGRKAASNLHPNHLAAVVTSGVGGTGTCNADRVSQGGFESLDAANRTVTTTTVAAVGAARRIQQQHRDSNDSLGSTSTQKASGSDSQAEAEEEDEKKPELTKDGKRKRTVGRPIIYQSDIKHLTEPERRKVRRRIANRESAQRVRLKRQMEMEELKAELNALRTRNEQLRRHVGQLEATTRGVLDRAVAFRDHYVKVSRDNILLYQQVLALQAKLPELDPRSAHAAASTLAPTASDQKLEASYKPSVTMQAGEQQPSSGTIQGAPLQQPAPSPRTRRRHCPPAPQAAEQLPFPRAMSLTMGLDPLPPLLDGLAA